MSKSRIIVALDGMTGTKALEFVEAATGRVAGFKVGLELFARYGPDLVDELREAIGFEKLVMDLKLHDIPNTVARATAAAVGCGAWGVTVHVAAGRDALRAAVGETNPYADQSSRVFGVTVLTSLDADELHAVGVMPVPGLEGDAFVRGLVRKRASTAKDCGVPGIVCSSHEISDVRAVYPGAILMVPGIRAPGAPPDDQRRTMTAGEAVAAGADLIVVGRPITQAEDPFEAIDVINADVADAEVRA